MEFATNPVTASEAATNLYNVMLQPGWGNDDAYPGLKPKMQEIFKRIAGLPWVPASWLAGVNALQAQYPDDLVKLAPTILNNGTANNDHALFLDSVEKLRVWHDLYQTQQRAFLSWANARNAAGKAEIDAALADAAFWDSAYKLAVYVRDAPGKAVSAVAAGVGSAVVNNFPFFVLLAAAGVGFLMWRTGALKKAFTKGK